MAAMFALDADIPTVPLPAHRTDFSRGILEDDIPSMELDGEHMGRSLSAKTPPMRIASPSPFRRNPAPCPEPEPAINFTEARNKAAKKKKKKQRGKNFAPAPALNIVRGFQTPVTSGGEESDYSNVSTPRLTPRLPQFSSVTSSPAMRPSSAASGISQLKLQMDILNLNGSPKPSLKRFESTGDSVTSSNASVTSDGNSDRTEMDSYEVPLDQEFVSPDVGNKPIFGAIEGGLKSITRKMTAADFEPLCCLGKGGYGTVILVKQHATGRLFAQKQLRKATLTVHKKLVEQTRTERAILESVNRHPFVVKLYYAFQDLEKLYLILEYAQGGELFHHLKMERMFNEEVAAFYMAEMVLALDHLHNTVGVVYRDLKPENCLLDSEGHLLLTDFGLSKVAINEDDRCNSILGTIEYMAPEVIQGQPYGMAVDWWSLGALGFDLLTGAPPFTGPNHKKIEEKIVKSKLVLPYFLGPDSKDLLTRLLRKEPSKRLGYNMPKDLQTIKKHRFFRKIDWKALEKREIMAPIQPLITDPELAENFAPEFTDLAVSPVATRDGYFGGLYGEGEKKSGMVGDAEGDGDREEWVQDPFGGFSFVASSSLLEVGDWGM